MPDMQRDDVVSWVYRRLGDHDFTRQLTAKAPDGSRPVVVVMPEDTMPALGGQILAVGGAANVAVPFLNAVMVFALHAEHGDDDIDPCDGNLLATDCTVGLLMARIGVDGGGMTYRYMADGATRPESARIDDAFVTF